MGCLATLKKEAAVSIEPSLGIHQTTRRHIPEDYNCSTLPWVPQMSHSTKILVVSKNETFWGIWDTVSLSRWIMLCGVLRSKHDKRRNVSDASWFCSVPKHVWFDSSADCLSRYEPEHDSVGNSANCLSRYEPEHVSVGNSADFVTIVVTVAAHSMSFPLLFFWAHLHLYSVDMLNNL